MYEAKYVLIQCGDNKYLVEKFDPKVHLCQEGWTFPNVSPFNEMSEVAHLRDLIIN